MPDPLERARLALDALPPEAPDQRFAEAVAALLVAERPAPYRVAIRHDPLLGPSPGARASRVSIRHRVAILETVSAAVAREWLTQALLCGCVVMRLEQMRDRPAGPSYNLAQQKTWARHKWLERQRNDRIEIGIATTEDLRDPDDDIPF